MCKNDKAYVLGEARLEENNVSQRRQKQGLGGTIAMPRV